MSDMTMRGLIAAPYTPFDRAGDLKLGAIERYAAHLVAAGVTGAFVCGTTGEGVSMTLDERMAVAQRWAEVAGGSLNVIVHVGTTSQRDAMALAAHAQRVGADAVSTLPPFFFRPSGAGQVVEFCRPIAAAAPELPFYYYHIPSMSGVLLPVVDLLAAARERIPTFRGVKFTHPDLMDFQRCLAAAAAADDEIELAWGADEMLLGALAVGAKAAVGSTYNYAAPIYQQMIAAHRAGDLPTARRLGVQTCDAVAVLLRHGVLRTGKATMAMIGLDCGPTRPPIEPLTADETAAVREAYEQIGLFAALKTHSGNGAAVKTASAIA